MRAGRVPGLKSVQHGASVPAVEIVRGRDAYEELFELAPDAYVFTSPSGKILHANRAACTLLNCPRRTIHGTPMIVFISARQYRQLIAEIPAALTDGEPLTEREISIHPLRQNPFPVAATVGVARDGMGRRVGLRWMLRDITERKRVEARLFATLNEKELLLREVYHRVKNNLQVISSLLSLQEAHLTDPAAVAVLRNARGRVRSMALVHERLYRSSDLSQVDFGDYLRQLAHELRHSYGLTAEKIRFSFDLQQASLGIDVAIPCSMIVHELVANALRHAFPNGRGGRIDVALGPEGDGRARLTVADNGVGLPPAEHGPRSGSLGLPLVEMMVEQIGGRLDVARSPGARFDVVFPLAGAPEQAEAAQ